MKQERVQEFYQMLKYYYLKPDSDWTDKAKSMRTVAHDFYNEITRSYGTFADALKEFYKWLTKKWLTLLKKFKKLFL